MKVRIKSANSVKCPKCGTLMSAKWLDIDALNVLMNNLTQEDEQF